MKKLKFILGVAGIFTLMMLSSCSNLDPFGKDTQNSSKKDYVSFTINTGSSSRLIAADSSYDISAVTRWTLSYTDSIGTKSVTWDKSSTTETNTTTTYLKKENDGSLKVYNFPIGTYDFELEGTYTDSEIHTVFGTKSKVKISSDETKNSISIIVGSKRTSSGTGGLDLIFSNLFSDNNNYENLSVVLVNLVTSKEISLSKDSDYSIESSNLKITKENIPSGLYKIEITHPGYKISIENGDCFVEIADGITTTKSDIKLSYETSKIFYATNKESSYNGLAKVSPKNLSDLLKNISDVKEQTIRIYMNEEIPEIDVDTIQSVSTEKQILVYKGLPSSSKECLLISDSGIDISGELTLVSSSENKNLKVNLITVKQEDADVYTITLKDGTSLSIENANLANMLTIKAVDSKTEKDNFSAYMNSPFITAKSDISKNLKLSYVEENGTQYTIVSQNSEETYSYYLKPSSISGLNIQSSTEAKISAKYENDDTVYTAGENVEIPYTNNTLSFSVTGIKNIDSSSWYLNDVLLVSESINPYSNDKVKKDEENTVTCLFSVDGNYYITQFTFKLVQINTTAVYGYNRNSVKSKLSYVNDYTDSNTVNNSIKEEDSSSVYNYWCLDDKSNLYVMWDKTLYKYAFETDSYNTSEVKICDFPDFAALNGTFKDIYYSDGYVYVLGISETCIHVYQVDENGSNLVVLDPNTDNLNLGLNQIAVDKSGNIYVSTDTSIYKTCIEGEGVNTTWKTLEEFYNTLSTDFSVSSGSIKITDLQIGDGCGNNTDTLYALARQFGPFGDYYSRGGLLSISLDDNSQHNIYGFNKDNFMVCDYTENEVTTTYKLYSPSKDSKTEFFGPTHFCAVVPKKLVILDDGYIFEDNNGSGKIPITRKDGFMEFDIEKEILNKYSENINALELADGTKLEVSAFDTTNYYEQ